MITPTLWQNVENFVQRRNTDDPSISVYSTQRTGPVALFRCYLTFYVEEHFIDVTMEDTSYETEEYRHYLDVAQLIYNIWHPFYGYQDDPTGDLTSSEEARNLDITWLYEINLFGPEIVEQFGREHVLATPAWLVKMLDDGRILLVPVLSRQDGRPEEYRFSFDEAAQHLGLRYELPEEV